MQYVALLRFSPIIRTRPARNPTSFGTKTDASATFDPHASLERKAQKCCQSEQILWYFHVSMCKSARRLARTLMHYRDSNNCFVWGGGSFENENKNFTKKIKACNLVFIQKKRKYFSSNKNLYVLLSLEAPKN